jgi:tetratricopeptide (TPR) repeat protein
MSESDIKEDLRAVSFADPTDILSSFLMAGDDLGRFIDGTEPATDERPLGFLNSTDFGSPRDVIALSDDLIRHQTDIARYLHNIDDSPIVADAVRRELKAQSGALRHLIRGQLKLLIFRDVDAAQTEFLEALRWREDWMEAQFQYSLALAMKAENLLRNHDAGAAVELLQNAVKQGGQDDARQYVLLGRAFEELGQIALADENYRRASDLLKTMGYPQIPFLRQKLLKSTGQSLSKGR